MRARSWKTVQTFRSSPVENCILSSLPRLSRRTPAATRASPPISTALTPHRLRSMWKVKLWRFLFLSLPSPISQNTNANTLLRLVCSFTGASSSDSEGEQHFEHVAQ